MNIKHIFTILLGTALLSCTSEALEDVKLSNELLNVEKEVEMTATETEKAVAVSADCSWTVSVDKQEWNDLTVQPLSGTGNGIITLKTGTNTAVNQRTAIMTITSAGGLRQKIAIRQTSGNATLTVSKTELTFNAVPAAAQTFTVTSNTAWRILGIDNSWLTVEPTSGGKGVTEVKVTAEEIQNDNDRKATLTVALDNGTEKYDIQVTQAGKTNVSLTLSPENPDEFEATGGQQVINVECDIQWNADMPATSWLTLNGSMGTGNGQFTINCQPNYTTEGRVQRITVTAGSLQPTSILVTQAAGTLPTITAPLALVDNTLSHSGASLTFGYTSTFPLTDYGICYSTTNSMPTIADTHVSLGEGSTANAETIVKLTDLDPHMTYYVRAYAKSQVNEGQLVYSNMVSFTTLSQIPWPDDNPYPQANTF